MPEGKRRDGRRVWRVEGKEKESGEGGGGGEEREGERKGERDR